MGYSLGGLLRIGSSSGGLDIYALYLFQKYGIEWTKVNNIINISIIAVSAIAFGTEVALYTIFSYFIRHITTESVYTNNRKLTVWIVGKDVSKVSSFVNTKFGRGTSLFKQVEGGYSREEKEVLMTVLSEFQYKELASMIHKIDENVFVTASRTDKLEGNFAFKKEKK